MFGFMSVTFFLSMWISNTATTAMLIPIVEAIVKELYEPERQKEAYVSNQISYNLRGRIVRKTGKSQERAAIIIIHSVNWRGSFTPMA